MNLFLGGIERKQNPFAPNQTGFHALSGFHLNETGALTKWGGFSQTIFGATMPQIVEALVPAEIIGAFNFILVAGAPQLIVATRNALYKKSGSSWILMASFAGAPIDRVSFVKQLEILYIAANGNNLKYDGVTVSTNGVAAPTAAPTLSPGVLGLGALTGAYSYKVTFLDALGNESNPSPASVTLNVALQNITLALIQAVPPGSVTMRVYRTTTGGGVYLFLAQVPVNTIVTDSSPDSSLGIAVENSANGVPPNSDILSSDNGVVLYAKTGSITVSYSAQGLPSAVHPADHAVLVSSDDEQQSTITGIRELRGLVCVFKNDSIWNFSVSEVGDVRHHRQVSSVGSVNHNGIVRIPGQYRLIFPSENGFYSYDGLTEQYISKPIEPIYQGLNPTRLKFMSGIAYEKLRCAIWAVSTGASSTNDLAICYFWDQDAWTTRPLPKGASFLMALEDATSVETFVAGGYDGFLRQGDSGESDDGEVMPCEFVPLNVSQYMFSDTIKSFYEVSLFWQRGNAAIFDVSLALNDPDGIYYPVGTINTANADTFLRCRFNLQGKRAYLKVSHAQIGTQPVLRGWELKWTDTGRVV